MLIHEGYSIDVVVLWKRKWVAIEFDGKLSLDVCCAAAQENRTVCKISPDKPKSFLEG